MNNTATLISNWIKDYANNAGINGLVVGISGGIDSSVVSALCAATGLQTTVVTLPIKQAIDQTDLSIQHAKWLTDKYDNVSHRIHNLDAVFSEFEKMFPVVNLLALANSRSRLRMTTLYQIAQTQRALVVGTGNKVEDFGIGFYTKYGDGGVDISPIADLYKTDVWRMGTSLGILDAIIEAAPTDGLWDDGRTDEVQIGMSYLALERAMQNDIGDSIARSNEEKSQLAAYREFRATNLHKMESIPVCKIPDIIKDSDL